MAGLNPLTKKRNGDYRKAGGLSRFRNRIAWRKKQTVQQKDDVSVEKVTFYWQFSNFVFNADFNHNVFNSFHSTFGLFDYGP